MTSNKVLVTDGRSLSCLAIVRTLGRDGMDVHVGETFRHNLSAYSRFAGESHVYPSAQAEPEAFKAEILALIRRERYDCVIPTRDATTIAIAEIGTRLPDGTKTLLDAPEKIERLNDKERCAKLAEQAGVPIPATYYPSETSIEEIRGQVRYPVLVKPTHGAGSRGIRLVERPEELRATYRTVTRAHGNAIVQEYVDHAGGHFSVGTVFDRNSEPRALHVYEELLQYPDSGGPAIRAVSVEPGAWVDGMLALLEAIDWVGPAHMDVLFDPVDDTYKLLEVNPRLWMSVTLSIKSGVDVPHVILNLAEGSQPSESGPYRTGLRYRWVLPNEILWTVEDGDRLTRAKTILLDRVPSECYGVLSRDDPSALLGLLAQSADFLLEPEKRRMVFDRGW